MIFIYDCSDMRRLYFGFTSGMQRTTRPVQCNTTSVGVPMASAGILMVKLTTLPTTKEVAKLK